MALRLPEESSRFWTVSRARFGGEATREAESQQGVLAWGVLAGLGFEAAGTVRSLSSEASIAPIPDPRNLVKNLQKATW